MPSGPQFIKRNITKSAKCLIFSNIVNKTELFCQQRQQL